MCRERFQSTRERRTPVLFEDRPALISLCRLQCSQDIGAKKAPVLLEAVKWRKQRCCAHGFEDAKGFVTRIGEPVRPRGLKQH